MNRKGTKRQFNYGLERGMVRIGGRGLSGIINVALKLWLGAYGGEKGKNLARKEDLEAILKEVEAVAGAQKRIEFQLSDEQWSRRTLWNHHPNTRDPEQLRNLDNLIEQAIHTLVAAERELVGHAVPAAIFLSEDASKCLVDFITHPKPEDFATHPQIRLFLDRVYDLNGNLTTFAKKDLGVTMLGAKSTS